MPALPALLPLLSAAACIKLQTAACRYTVSSLCWYKSTNTDAVRARRACRALCALAGDHKTSLLALLVQKLTQCALAG